MPNGHRTVLPPDARLSLITLGRAALVCTHADGRATELLGPGKLLALLAYLAFSPRRTATREHLIDLLWADSDPERAAHALRQTVWQIRHVLGDKALVTRNGDLVLGRRIDSDRDAFLAAVESGSLEAAVDRYAGDFLPSLAVPGGAGFEQWADLERIRLRTAFLRTGEALVRRHLTAGHVRDAQKLARRVRDADRLNESGWRLLLEALAAGKDFVAAAMEADALDHLLGAEEREPEPATRAALRLARQVPIEEGSPKSTLVAELVGREKEFASIVGAWEAARHGPASQVHITAPAGLGKTRLLQDALARLRAGGARAVYVRASPGERNIASAFAGDLAATLARLPGATGVSTAVAGTLVALNPALSSLYAAPADKDSGEDAIRRRTIALAELLQAVADEAPVALLLDDLHWADHQSRQIVQGMRARIDSARVLLVSASRPTPEHATADGAAHLKLESLSDVQIGALIGSLGALPSDPWAGSLPGWLHASTGGSPLLVIESIQLALERGSLTLDGTCWACPSPTTLAGELAAGGALRHRIEQLDRTSQWILLTLAAAGMPLSSALLARLAARPEGSITPLLGTLEERGLVARTGSEWEPGHDEIGALALETATPDALRAAHGSLGKSLAEEALPDASLAPHAARHLAAGGERSVLVEVWIRWLRDRRRRGDRRPPSDLAAELLGDSVSETLVSRMVAGLPVNLRLGLDSPRRIAVAAVVMIAVGASAAALLNRHPPAPLDAAFIVADARGADTAPPVRVELRQGDWQALRQIDLDGGGRPYTLLKTGDFVGSPTASPDGASWIVPHVYPDSGGIDLDLVRPDGSRHRLTSNPADDGTPSFSPDGWRFAFSTGRWDPLSHDHVAVGDLTSADARQLTGGDARESTPRWSPDGSRIAFLRRYFDRRPPMVCWTTADGLEPVCFRLVGLSPTSVEGWADPLHLIVTGQRGSQSVLELLDIQSHATRELANGVLQAAASPDGRWIACLCNRSPEESPFWFVFRSDRPDEKKPLIRHGKTTAEITLQWATTGMPTGYLDSLSVVVPAIVVRNAQTRLRALGLDPQGTEVPLPLLRWWSSDKAVAVVDSTGLLTPRRTGSLTVHVSAGGWREDSARVVVESEVDSTVLREDWTAGVDRAFVPYGMPRPATLIGPGRVSTFWNHGDGDFNSGAYTKAAFDPTRGIGVEARFSAPLTELQWQYLDLRFIGDLDSARLASWDHRTGALPITPGTLPAVCGFSLPGGEGEEARNRIVVTATGHGRSFEARASINQGRWHTVRVQIFPDGRCGVALDGAPLVIMEEVVTLDRRYRLDLTGKSVRTKVLVGPLEVWEGVRGGVDWFSVGRHD